MNYILTMHILDASRVVLCCIFLLATLKFFILAWKSKDIHPNDVIVQQHFMEHAVAASMAFMGAIQGLIWSVVHLLQVNQYVNAPLSFYAELPGVLAMDFIIFSSILFMWHMIKEQTPGHPYYQREVGEIIVSKE